MSKSIRDRPASDARGVIELLGTRPVRSKGKLVGRWGLSLASRRRGAPGRDRRAACCFSSRLQPPLAKTSGLNAGAWAACRPWPLAFWHACPLDAIEPGRNRIDRRQNAKQDRGHRKFGHAGSWLRSTIDRLPTRATDDDERSAFFCLHMVVKPLALPPTPIDSRPTRATRPA
jgi:hypothetical protein